MNSGAVVLLTGLGIINIPYVVWKSLIIWSSAGPCLFSLVTLLMQCFLWIHGWPFSLPELLSAAPPSSGRCSLLAYLFQLAYSYSLAFLKNHLKRSVFLIQPQCHIPLLCSTCLQCHLPICYLSTHFLLLCTYHKLYEDTDHVRFALFMFFANASLSNWNLLGAQYLFVV